jgi:hypothetical protein
MSKIIAAANSMIINEKKISPVMHGGREVFFIYDGKYVWSMRKDNSEYWLYYYPGYSALDDLIHIEDWEGIDVVPYATKEIGTQEARDTFSELYTIIKEKLYGVDEVLNKIIGDS